MDIKATPAEIEITAIVGELVHDGFMDLSVDDIITLEQRTHEGYKHIADVFQVWVLELLLRRMHERAEADGELAARIEAAEWFTTTTEDV